MVNTVLIKKKMADRGITQTAAAAVLGIKQATLSLKLNNRRPFYLDEAKAFADVLGISRDEFGAYFFAS